MDPIIQYLATGSLPDDQTEAQKIRIKAPQYTIKEGILYRKGYLTPWLRCVNPEEADYVLREVHFGPCGAQAGARSIVQKEARLRLAYGFEAVLPTEIGLPTYRIKTFDPLANDANICLNLELLEERREMTALRAANYKTSTER
nr:protein NYNRIN-like [Tanacetum cinerariifolium]